jgi:hypothetical protein
MLKKEIILRLGDHPRVEVVGSKDSVICATVQGDTLEALNEGLLSVKSYLGLGGQVSSFSRGGGLIVIGFLSWDEGGVELRLYPNKKMARAGNLTIDERTWSKHGLS